MNTNKVVVLLNVIVFIVIFMAIYKFYYLSNEAVLAEREGIYKKFSDINAQLDDFDNIRNNIKEQEPKLNEIYSIYEDYYKSNDEIISSYKNMIEQFLLQHGISVYDNTIKVEQDKKKTNLSLSISFKASYDQLYQLLFDIERFSTISDLKISYLGDISFKCKPNLYSQDINDFFLGRKEKSRGEIEETGYFKEVSDNIMSAMNIGKFATWKDLFPVPKNPLFAGYVSKQTAAKRIKSKKKSEGIVRKPFPSDIELEGVMYENNEPIAIVDGKLLKVGSIHKGVRLVRINKNNVDFENYGQIVKVRMKN